MGADLSIIPKKSLKNDMDQIKVYRGKVGFVRGYFLKIIGQFKNAKLQIMGKNISLVGVIPDVDWNCLIIGSDGICRWSEIISDIAIKSRKSI